LYFAEDYGHWKANTVRFAGGDGVRAVDLSGRKAGCGYAHSGPIAGRSDARGASSAEEAIRVFTRGDEWFEVLDGEWEAVPIRASACWAWSLDFCADRVVVDERHMRGEDGLVDRDVSGPVSFRGWRHGGRGSQVLLTLPALPDRMTADGPEGLVVPLMAGDLSEQRGGTNILGDPDFVILRTSSRL